MDAYKKPKLTNQYYDEFVKEIPNQDSKTFAITGTTTGTGYNAAKTLLQKGATVLLLNRNSDRLDSAIEHLKNDCQNSDFHSIICDLQSFNSVKDAAAKVIDHCKNNGLDGLCNNAGVMALSDIATEDGFDIQMQTNHLSHFLLTKILYPTLNQTAGSKGESRIVNHSSISRLQSKTLENKYLERNGGNLGGNGSSMLFGGARWVRYSQTKLANAAFTAALHEKLSSVNSKVKSLVAHPGLSMTHLQDTTIRNGGMSKYATNLMMKLSGQTYMDGSIGIIKALTDTTLSSGSFIGPGKGMMATKGEVISFPLENYYDNPGTRDQLWELSCNAIGQDFII